MIELTEDEIYNSYYTYDELLELIERVKNTFFPEDYQKEYFIKEIEQQIVIMFRHKLNIIPAHQILSHCYWQNMVLSVGIRPHLYEPVKDGFWKIPSAPNLRSSDCCSNCIHHIADYDSCECSIHTQSSTYYNPPQVEQLEVFYTNICDDYKRVVDNETSNESL